MMSLTKEQAMARMAPILPKLADNQIWYMLGYAEAHAELKAAKTKQEAQTTQERS